MSHVDGSMAHPIPTTKWVMGLGGKKELEHISREIYITGKRNFSKNVEM